MSMSTGSKMKAIVILQRAEDWRDIENQRVTGSHSTVERHIRHQQTLRIYFLLKQVRRLMASTAFLSLRLEGTVCLRTTLALQSRPGRLEDVFTGVY